MSSLQQEQEDQIWALSALFFAVEGVAALAEKGQWAEENFAVLLPSLSRFDRARVSDYYDQPERLSRGRDALVHYFANTGTDKRLGYALQTLQVAARLQAKPELTRELIRGLHDTAAHIPQFGLLHDNLFARYSELYKDIAGRATRRIRVYGQESHLRQSETVNRIRSLLLCGLRAAALWRANGGNRWQLMFGRGGIVTLAKQLDMGAAYKEEEERFP